MNQSNQDNQQPKRESNNQNSFASSNCYARPSTRGELRDKLQNGIPCEVATTAVEMTIAMFHGWLNFNSFKTRASENSGWTIFEHNVRDDEPPTN